MRCQAHGSRQCTNSVAHRAQGGGEGAPFAGVHQWAIRKRRIGDDEGMPQPRQHLRQLPRCCWQLEHRCTIIRGGTSKHRKPATAPFEGLQRLENAARYVRKVYPSQNGRLCQGDSSAPRDECNTSGQL